MARSGSVRPPEPRLEDPAASCCMAAAVDEPAIRSGATPFSAMKPLASAMKIGHSCAEPFPVVIIVMVSAAIAHDPPTVSKVKALAKDTSRFRLTLVLPRTRSGASHQACAGADRRQQRHHPLG